MTDTTNPAEDRLRALLERHREELVMRESAASAEMAGAKPTYVRGRCGSCPADVIWTVSSRTGDRHPIDYDPSPQGNVALRPGPGLVPISTVLPVDKRFGRTDLRTSHFVTCPAASKYRRRDRGRSS